MLILISGCSFHAYNIGHLSSRAADPLFSPCTPAAVMRLLESSGATISGSNAVVLGRSDIVGSPVASMLRSADATVTQCHSKTKNIESIVRCFSSLQVAISFILNSRSRMPILSSLLSGRLSS